MPSSPFCRTSRVVDGARYAVPQCPDNSPMGSTDNQQAWLPADIPDITKWMRWALPVDACGKQPQVLEREVWHWVESDVCHAMSDELSKMWDDTPASAGRILLHPDDLPSLDGLMVFSAGLNPAGGRCGESMLLKEDAVVMPLAAIRWTASHHGVWLESFAVMPRTPYCNAFLAARGHIEEWMPGSNLVDAMTDLLEAPLDELVVLGPLARDKHGHNRFLTCLPRLASDGDPYLSTANVDAIWQWGHSSITRVEDGRPPEAGGMRPAEAWNPEFLELPSDQEIAAEARRAASSGKDEASAWELVLYALWSMVTAPARESLPRAVFRRLPKQRQRDRSAVRVIKLREHGNDGERGTSAGRASPVRHYVSGHWRKQWYPSLKQNRARYIQGHLRGGDSKSEVPRTGPRAVRVVAAAKRGD